MKRRSLIAGGAAATAFAALKPVKAQTTAYAVVPTLDDPQNTSGLGTAAILRGTVSTYSLAGLTPGAGQTTAVRQANATALQNAINYCAANGKFFEVIPNTYEINTSTGLVVPAGAGFVLRGSPNAIIKQFYNSGSGAPVLSIGDATGSVQSTSFDIEGLWLQYGTSQSGLTSAKTLLVNALSHSRLDFIGLGGVGLNPGYNNLTFGGGPCFSNVYSNFDCNQAIQNQIYVGVNGTGNVFTNIYLNNGGSGIYNPLGGNYLAFEGGITNEMTFTQLNCEWGACNRLMDLQNMVGLHFIDLHVEGIKFTGSSPVCFNTAHSNVTWDTCDFVDVVANAANMSGSLCVMLDYNGDASTLQMNNFTWINNFTGQINTNVLMFSPSGGTLGQDTSVVTINKGGFHDQTGFTNAAFIQNVQFDVHMPVTSTQFFAPLRFDSYNWGAWGSVLNKPVIYPIHSTYTHYGQHQNATLLVDAFITNFTITLSNLMGASGTQNVPTGTVTHVRRESGSASGTLTVKDDAGTTLTTNTTAATDYFYQFNGTHYVAFTQVT